MHLTQLSQLNKLVQMVMDGVEIFLRDLLFKTPLDSTGQRWTEVDRAGQRWTELDSSGRFPNKNWTALDSTGQRWTALDRGGQHWTALDYLIFIRQSS